MQFLVEFKKLFTEDKSPNGRSIYITQKRLTPVDEVDGPAEQQAAISKFNPSEPVLQDSKIHKPEETYPVIIKVSKTVSKTEKIKISTIVKIDDLDRFWKEYTSIIKQNFTGLKKKDKGKKKKKSSNK